MTNLDVVQAALREVGIPCRRQWKMWELPTLLIDVDLGDVDPEVVYRAYRLGGDQRPIGEWATWAAKACASRSPLMRSKLAAISAEWTRDIAG